MKELTDLLPVTKATAKKPLPANRHIRCMIVDDEHHAISLLSRHIEQTPGLELLYASSSPTEILTKAETEPFDLLFLDVEMPLLCGFDLLHLLKGKCFFVLCSGHRKYALKGYEHDVCDYLLKPITYSRFIKAVEKVKQQVELKQLSTAKKDTAPAKKFILLKGDRKHRRFRICLDDIDYIKSMGHYLGVVVKGERKTILSTMNRVLDQLPAEEFIRVHQSYIIPLNRISYIDFEELGLSNVAIPIPIGDTYRKELMEALKGEM